MFSIVIASKNSVSTLIQCIEVLLAEISAADEIVIIDDNSEDDTYKELARLYANNPQVTYYRNNAQGISSARNLGNSYAKNEYIAVMDADDRTVPGSFNVLRSEVEQTHADIYYGDIEIHYKDRTIDYPSYPEIQSANCARRAIFIRPIVPFKHSALIYKKSLWKKVGGYDETLTSKVDIDLALSMLEHGCRVRKVDYKLAVHYKHTSQVSHQRLKRLKNWKRVIWKHESNCFLRYFYLVCRASTEIIKSLARG